MDQLMDVRNAAAHEGRPPNHEAAAQAMVVATQIVTAHVALDLH
jgi:hypothetical protein